MSTQELVTALNEMEDRIVQRLEKSLDEMLEEKLELNLEQKLDEKLEQKLDEKLEQKLDEKLDQKLDEKLDQKLDEKLEQKFEQKLAPIRESIDKLNARSDSMEQNIRYLNQMTAHMNQKLNDFHTDFKYTEKNFRRDIRHLQDNQETILAILKQRNLLSMPSWFASYSLNWCPFDLRLPSVKFSWLVLY